MDKEVEELTLLLMYLTSWDEKGFVENKNGEITQSKVKTCWKGYSFDVINKLTDEEYLYYSKGKTVSLTPEGETIAKELMNKYIKK